MVSILPGIESVATGNSDSSKIIFWRLSLYIPFDRYLPDRNTSLRRFKYHQKKTHFTIASSQTRIPNRSTFVRRITGEINCVSFGFFSPFPAHHHKSLQDDTEKQQITSTFLFKYFYGNFDGENGLEIVKQISRDQDQCKRNMTESYARPKYFKC